MNTPEKITFVFGIGAIIGVIISLGLIAEPVEKAHPHVEGYGTVVGFFEGNADCRYCMKVSDGNKTYIFSISYDEYDMKYDVGDCIQWNDQGTIINAWGKNNPNSLCSCN